MLSIAALEAVDPGSTAADTAFFINIIFFTEKHK